jgi:hypothetical protein
MLELSDLSAIRFFMGFDACDADGAVAVCKD